MNEKTSDWAGIRTVSSREPIFGVCRLTLEKRTVRMFWKSPRTWNDGGQNVQARFKRIFTVSMVDPRVSATMFQTITASFRSGRCSRDVTIVRGLLTERDSSCFSFSTVLISAKSTDRVCKYRRNNLSRCLTRARENVRYVNYGTRGRQSRRYQWNVYTIV